MLTVLQHADPNLTTLLQPVRGSSELDGVFSFQPRKELGSIASQLHW